LFAMLAAGCNGGSSSSANSAGPSGSNATAASTGAAASGGASSNADDDDDAPHVPHNNVVDIYNMFGLSTEDTTLLGQLSDRLGSEGYQVTRYEDPTEGAGSQGTATLANFVSMANQASVIIINGHGEDFSGTTQSCAAGKGFTHCGAFPPDPTPSSAAPTPSSPVPAPAPKAQRSTTVQPVLQVEWYPTWEAEQAAYDRYVAQGYDPSWLFDPRTADGALWATTLIPWRRGDAAFGDGKTIDYAGNGLRPWLGITAAGIAHFFKGHNIDFVDNLACHSIALAPSFDSRSYFGHAATACLGFEVNDELTLFDRLLGKSGVAQRPTDQAYAQGGFTDQFFQLASSSKPVVLSPAVESVSPKEGGRAKPGATTPLDLHFDAAMDQSSTDGLVTVTGCGATTANPKWASSSELKLDLKVPADPSDTRITVTVHHDRHCQTGRLRQSTTRRQ